MVSKVNINWKHKRGVALTEAMMSTHFPQLLKCANLSVLSLAATVTLKEEEVEEEEEEEEEKEEEEEEEANVFDSVHHRSVFNKLFELPAEKVKCTPYNYSVEVVSDDCG